jgi:hypothetical protein
MTAAGIPRMRTASRCDRHLEGRMWLMLGHRPAPPSIALVSTVRHVITNSHDFLFALSINARYCLSLPLPSPDQRMPRLPYLDSHLHLLHSRLVFCPSFPRYSGHHQQSFPNWSRRQLRPQPSLPRLRVASRNQRSDRVRRRSQIVCLGLRRRLV